MGEHFFQLTTYVSFLCNFMIFESIIIFKAYTVHQFLRCLLCLCDFSPNDFFSVV